VRSAWFQAREAWPRREAPVAQLTRERARAAVALPAAAGASAWVGIGPENIGGRMTSVVCHPADPDRLWAGAAGGGVWHSVAAGTTWQPLWHHQDSLNVGSLAIDPQQPDTLYCGTGEANLSADSHAGVGVYRSLDAGATWLLLAPAAAAGLPPRIGALAVDPFASTHVLAGGLAHAAGEPTGLFRSTDSGATWAAVPLAGQTGFRCHDVRFDPQRQGRVLVAVAARGVLNGIWRSVDGAASWQHLAGGLPPPDQVGRCSLAVAPSDTDVGYALLERGGGVLGVFRTADGGEGWTSVGGAHFGDERQMSYNNTIAVHPTDPDVVLCGGVDLHRTADGGTTWQQVTHWDADRGATDYAHADHHAVIMPAADPGRVYDLNDGGMDLSTDAGLTWQNHSNGLATNMFYDLAVAQTDGRMVAGGAQDNGTIASLDGTPDGFVMLTGGDGGWVLIDPTDERHLFTTWQGMVVWRFRSTDGWKRVSPPEDLFRMWMVFLSMDANDRKTVFTGSRRVWRTRDDGNNWTAVSGNLDGSDITAVEVARADGTRVYVGTENGGFFRSVDRGATWSGNLAGTVLPGLSITRIESRPDDADVVYSTVANFGNRHVFRSADGGLTWIDIDRGDLPDTPLHSIAVPAAHPGRVYVCGDAGVFVSDDEGASWRNLTGNLPTVMVVDIVYHETDRTLTAATYGRSMWRLQVD
jgi:photosystem II stability/assembly factor-like uncharacterized protein